MNGVQIIQKKQLNSVSFRRDSNPPEVAEFGIYSVGMTGDEHLKILQNPEETTLGPLCTCGLPISRNHSPDLIADNCTKTTNETIKIHKAGYFLDREIAIATRTRQSVSPVTSGGQRLPSAAGSQGGVVKVPKPISIATATDYHSIIDSSQRLGNGSARMMMQRPHTQGNTHTRGPGRRGQAQLMNQFLIKGHPQQDD